MKRGEASAHKVKATIIYDGVEETSGTGLIDEEGHLKPALSTSLGLVETVVVMRSASTFLDRRQTP